MRGRGRRARRREPAEDLEVDRALDAMSAAELRAAVRAVLDQLDDGVKDSVIDWRRHAFREELARACQSLGVSVPA